MAKKVYLVENLDCANCAAKVEAALGALPEVQEAVLTISWGAPLNPSGLWHQLHLKGQPFKNTVCRRPGPSKTVNSSKSKTTPSLISAPLH